MRTKEPLELSEEDEQALHRVLTHMARLIENSPWESIETAPRDGSPVLVYVPDSKLEWYKQFCAVAYWVTKEYDGTAGWFDNFDKIEPTHWMKIPEYPNDNP
jgi:hypothetical protein